MPIVYHAVLSAAPGAIQDPVMTPQGLKYMEVICDACGKAPLAGFFAEPRPDEPRVACLDCVAAYLVPQVVAARAPASTGEPSPRDAGTP